MKLLLFLLALAKVSLCTNTFNYFQWYPGESSVFTRFKSTLVVPPLPTTNPTDFRAVWPGLQPESNSMVFQTVITNEIPGTWQFYLTQCCTPQQAYSSFQEVYPGDRVTSEFIHGDISGNWTVFWSVENHTTGATIRNAAGSIDLEMQGPLDHMMFAIETATSSAWDFGPVIWTNIMMEANTTDHTWCAQPFHTVGYNLTGPVTSDVGRPGLTTCNIPKLVFVEELKT